MIKKKSPNWDYKHFDDTDILDYFTNNPLEEFPLIIEKFNEIKCGAHKADLFRYYYLYINGGVFLDSDAMLEVNLLYCCKDYDFFSVNSSYCPGNIFQGLIGATPNNPIIYDALKDMYFIDITHLNNTYLLVCTNLYNILKNNYYSQLKIKLYQEIYGTDKIALTIDTDNSILILAHYFSIKVVPPLFLMDNKFILAKILKGRQK